MTFPTTFSQNLTQQKFLNPNKARNFRSCSIETRIRLNGDYQREEGDYFLKIYLDSYVVLGFLHDTRLPLFVKNRSKIGEEGLCEGFILLILLRHVPGLAQNIEEEQSRFVEFVLPLRIEISSDFLEENLEEIAVIVL